MCTAGNLVREPAFSNPETDPRRLTMIKIVCATGTALALLSSAALADFYVVQEKSTKECKIVETRPTETTWVQVGPLAFKTRDEAEKQIKVICKK
jgi:hypothetical protein